MEVYHSPQKSGVSIYDSSSQILSKSIYLETNMKDRLRRRHHRSQLNQKCQDLSKSAFSGGGSRSTQPKDKVPRSVQICIGKGGGPDKLNPKSQICIEEGGAVVVQTNSTQSAKSAWGGEGGRGWWSRPTFLKYLSGGTQGILNTNFANWNVVLHQSLTHYVCGD